MANARAFEMKPARERRDLNSYQTTHVAQRVADLEDEIANAAALLDCLPFGVILLDSRGRFLRANQRAQRLLAAGDALSGSPDGLRALRAEDTAKLRQLVARAMRAESGESVLALHRGSGQRALQLCVTPIKSAPTQPWCVRRSGVAVFVADPDDPVRPTVDGLRTTYGLTTAQARVAVLLSVGMTLSGIASRTRVQVNTVRAHLKEIYAKTGTRRQGELVRLLLHGALALLRGRP